jgi:hypothetical protein
VPLLEATIVLLTRTCHLDITCGKIIYLATETFFDVFKLKVNSTFATKQKDKQKSLVKGIIQPVKRGFEIGISRTP